MSKETSTIVPDQPQSPVSVGDDVHALWQRVDRSTLVLEGGRCRRRCRAAGQRAVHESSGCPSRPGVTSGDVDILRFLAAAELIEADLWTQYNELGGVNGGNPAYMAAL